MKHSVFEYIYRDAGNFKVWGEILLEGEFTAEEVSHLLARFEGGEHFIAEQIGVPPLYAELWHQCQCEPSDELDHAWHEFGEIRAASSEDFARLKPWGTTTDLLASIDLVESWNLAQSQYGGFGGHRVLW